ncbi:hypothetical protein RYH73_06435 [Olivibacter sp. CPCC 100613]|uniref:toxin-antitoxin system YwqK family antitoxin n=1 Tax=Olivibacter sp. CPCC 100613 TaxID=3079931 RepID=UPI002FF7B33D
MKLNFTLIIGIYLLSFSLPSYGQKELLEALPYKNKVTVRHADGTFQVAELMIKEKVEQADPMRTYAWYERDSIRYTQGAFKGRLLHGTYQELYADKSLKVLGAYYKGLKAGEWRYMDPNGTLRRLSIWYLGEENGKYALYDEHGQLKEKGRLFKGLKEGVITRYQTQDSVQKRYTNFRHNVAQEKEVNWFDKVKLFFGF